MNDFISQLNNIYVKHLNIFLIRSAEKLLDSQHNREERLFENREYQSSHRLYSIQLFTIRMTSIARALKSKFFIAKNFKNQK